MKQELFEKENTKLKVKYLFLQKISFVNNTTL